MVKFVRNELKRIQTSLSKDNSENFDLQRHDEEMSGDEKQRKSSREAFLKITLHILRTMKQEKLADRLQSSKIFLMIEVLDLWVIYIFFKLTFFIHSGLFSVACQRKMKSKLKKKFQCVFEGISKQETQPF